MKCDRGRQSTVILGSRRVELRVEWSCGGAHLIVVHSINETRSSAGIANEIEPGRCKGARHVAETTAVRGDDAALDGPHAVVVRHASDDAADFVVADGAIADIECNPGCTETSAACVTADRAVDDVQFARGSRRKLGLDSTSSITSNATVADVGGECSVAWRRYGVAFVGIEGAAADVERTEVMINSTTLRIEDRTGVSLESRVRDPNDGT